MNEKGDTTVHTAETERMAREHCQPCHTNTRNPGIHGHNIHGKTWLLTKMPQGNIEHLHSSTTIQIEAVVRTFSHKETAGPNDFMGKFYQTAKKRLTAVSHRHLRREVCRYVPAHSMRPTQHQHRNPLWAAGKGKLWVC